MEDNHQPYLKICLPQNQPNENNVTVSDLCSKHWEIVQRFTIMILSWNQYCKPTDISCNWKRKTVAQRKARFQCLRSLACSTIEYLVEIMAKTWFIYILKPNGIEFGILALMY